jgi:hypothetical protein
MQNSLAMSRSKENSTNDIGNVSSTRQGNWISVCKHFIILISPIRRVAQLAALSKHENAYISFDGPARLLPTHSTIVCSFSVASAAIITAARNSYPTPAYAVLTVFNVNLICYCQQQLIKC